MKYLVEVTDVRVFVVVEAEGIPEAAAKAWEGDGQILLCDGNVLFDQVHLLTASLDDFDTGDPDSFIAKLGG